MHTTYTLAHVHTFVHTCTCTHVRTHLHMQTQEHGNFSSSLLCMCAAPLPLSLCSLLFTSNGAAVTSQKVNNHQPQDNNVCSCKPDQILAMTADPDSQRLFWVSLRYSRLILNWARYTRETCNNRCVLTYIHAHTHAFLSLCIHMYVRIYVHMYVCISCIRTYVHVRI